MEMKTNRALKVSQIHPCFASGAHNKYGRLHLPVSASCNIQCRFCSRVFNRDEERPGVTSGILCPEDAIRTVDRALELCPRITVVGIAGPGDALASDAALEVFRAVHAAYPGLIMCLSTNGLMLPDRAEELANAGVKTVTVTVNAVDPAILEKIVSFIVLRGRRVTGREMGKILISRQLEGIRRASALGMTVKVNTVLIPWINDLHIEDIAKEAGEAGADIYNIIPLIPQHEMAHIAPPDCGMLGRARASAEKYVDVFYHCRHCRADACGIPGKNDFSWELYGETMETFSHG
ncbi:MAG: radical SAM protein [Synergistaceae bacterium]|jgi:nitrogen fixation protein NifB|nr:radical SAM protein [Synergistaceae bacterium]